MKKNPKSALGSLGEILATRYLRERGFEILQRNYQNSSGRRLGEIDIIAREKSSQELVFVEVKTRNFHYSNTRPEENITREKLKRLSRIAEDYLRHHPENGSLYRFDALAVFLDRQGKKCRISHLDNIFL